MTTIGFFGDSFCAEVSNQHSESNGYKTYIEKLISHYNADLVNLGVPGCSVWDTTLIQFKPFEKNPPDICIFSWTGGGGLFHRTQRDLHFPRIILNENSSDLIKAAKGYFEYFFDDEKASLEVSSMMMYFDETILSKIYDKSKIIHLWSLGKIPYNMKITDDDPYNHYTEYHHKWKYGKEIRPALMSKSYEGVYKRSIIEVLKLDKRPNHISGEESNNIVFEEIKKLIDADQ